MNPSNCLSLKFFLLRLQKPYKNWRRLSQASWFLSSDCANISTFRQDVCSYVRNWRRGRDSNSGDLSARLFSRQVLSTAQPPLRRSTTKSFPEHDQGSRANRRGIFHLFIRRFAPQDLRPAFRSTSIVKQREAPPDPF